MRMRGEGEQSSARQNASLLYERNGRRNPPTKRPASDDVVLTTPSFALVPTRRFALLARHSRAQNAYIVRGADFALRSAPLRRTSGWRSGVPGGEEIGAIVKWSIITDSLRASLLLRCTCSYFLFTTLLSQ